MNELAVKFDCQGSALLGILHQATISANVGVIIVVAGGPQYRAGVSRQFVSMARLLADNNIPALRFDHRGTGDSEGNCRGFIDMGEDIKSAIDVLMSKNPNLEKVVLWGECESASAIAFYGHTDERVSGLFLVNPWIRTEAGEAQTYIKHYYLSRMMEKEFWRKVLSGKFSISSSLSSFFDLIKKAKKGKTKAKLSRQEATTAALVNLPLPQRLEQSTALYKGKIFILTSGNDLIAQEFKDYVATSSAWQKMIQADNFNMRDIAEADHSFSRSDWRQSLFDSVKDWVQDEHA